MTSFSAEISPDGSKAGVLSFSPSRLYARELTDTNPVVVNGKPTPSSFAMFSYPDGAYYTSTTGGVCPFTDAPVSCDTSKVPAFYYGNANSACPARLIIRGTPSPVGIVFFGAISQSTGTVFSNQLNVVGESSIAVTSNAAIFYLNPSNPTQIQGASFDVTGLTLGFLRTSIMPVSPLLPGSPDRYTLINPVSAAPVARLLRLDKATASVPVEVEWTGLLDLDNEVLATGSLFFRQAVWYESLKLLGVLYLVQDPPVTGPKQWRVNFYRANKNTAR